MDNIVVFDKISKNLSLIDIVALGEINKRFNKVSKKLSILNKLNDIKSTKLGEYENGIFLRKSKSILDDMMNILLLSTDILFLSLFTTNMMVMESSVVITMIIMNFLIFYNKNNKIIFLPLLLCFLCNLYNVNIMYFIIGLYSYIVSKYIQYTESHDKNKKISLVRKIIINGEENDYVNLLENIIKNSNFTKHELLDLCCMCCIRDKAKFFKLICGDVGKLVESFSVNNFFYKKKYKIITLLLKYMFKYDSVEIYKYLFTEYFDVKNQNYEATNFFVKYLPLKITLWKVGDTAI
jgi:hypothetical protein